MARSIWNTLCLSSICLRLILVSATHFQALDDSILHKINWAGSIQDAPTLDESLTSISMTSARNEKYECVLPKLQWSSEDDATTYNGLSPFDLISPLFSQFVCTFKLESFWTYELCHGKYIRQYHEEKDGKKVKLHEYYLGRWDKEDLNAARSKFEEEFAQADYKANLPLKKIDGVNMPALQLNMTDGTMCDLKGEPRTTRVLYVCDPKGKHELHSLEEVSTCEYEIVVLSPLLCSHPEFKSKEVGENLINCYSTHNAPQVPRALTELENESFKMKHEHLLQNLESLLESKLGKSEQSPNMMLNDEERSKVKITVTPIDSGIPVYGNAFLASFLEGKECLTGGSHWWKFEFCYGKHVVQYHEESGGGSRTTITLGRWDVEKHKEWLDRHPHKKPPLTSLKRTVYHYYSGGAQCDQTGQPRTVEVRLRCIDHSNPSAVALYLMEPKTCEYTLTVESALFCPLLSSATVDYGLIDTARFLVSYKASSEESPAQTVEESPAQTVEESSAQTVEESKTEGGEEGGVASEEGKEPEKQGRGAEL